MSHNSTSQSASAATLMIWMDAIIGSLHDLSSMLDTENIQIFDHYTQTEHDLSNYIFLYGDKHAYQILLRSTMRGFTTLARRLLGADEGDELSNLDVFDSVGELTNIIVGNVKTELSSHFKNLAIGLPQTITGDILYPPPEAEKTIGVQIDDVRFSVAINLHPLPTEVRKQRLLEKKVREREARLKSILDTAADAIITVDEEYNVESMNNAAEKIFGLLSKDLKQYGAKNILPDIEDILSSTSAFDEKTGETMGVRADKTKFPVEISHSKLPLGEKQSVVLIIRNVSDRKCLEEKLNQARQLDAIGQLAAGVAHEINTPIQYVNDNAQFLKDSFSDIFSLIDKYDALKLAAVQGNVNQRMIEEIVGIEEGVDLDYLTDEVPLAITQALEGVERVSSIVAAMKAFSHPGKESYPVDLNKALETTIIVSRNEWKYVADMETEFDENMPMTSCVAGEVNQVFLNIIVNAAHAIAVKNAKSQKKGKISIKTCVNGSWAEIRISDNAGGIPETVQSKIFEPFFTTKEVGKGTGQGLYIGHSIIVKKHKGELFFETNKGIGTTFFIHLPLDQPYQETPTKN